MNQITNRIYVTKQDKITPYENNLVTLTLENGEKFEPLEPRRLFPVSNADIYVSLLNADGKEIAIIRSLTDLSIESRETVNCSLNDYYLVPTITRILSITEKYGTLHWSVETEHGIKEFDIRNRNHDIKVYPDGRVRVRDSDDNRYIIPNYHKLDKQSRTRLVADL